MSVCLSVVNAIFACVLRGFYGIHASAACVSVCLSVVNAIFACVLRGFYGIH